MVDILVRNISEEDHRALETRAAEHNRSTEAEIHSLIQEAVRPTEQIKLGSALAALGRKYNITEFDIERELPTEPVSFDDDDRS